MMMKLLTLLVVVLTVTHAAAEEVVRCLAASNSDACGDVETNPCDAFAVADGNFEVGDVVKIWYEIAAQFENEVCQENLLYGESCQTMKKSIFAEILDGAPTESGVTIELTEGGAAVLCPHVCLDTRVPSIFTGICQPGEGTAGGMDFCVDADNTKICSAALGSPPDAVVSVECIRGPTCPQQIVQCLAGSNTDTCGDVETNPCDAFAVADGIYVEDDVVKITYKIIKQFDDPVCTTNETGDGMSCDHITKEIFAQIVSGTPAGSNTTIELTVGGAMALCPHVCLDTSDAFTGICQPGDGSNNGKDGCVNAEVNVPLTEICTAPLGSDPDWPLGTVPDAVVSVECIWGPGPTCESTTAPPPGELTTTPPPGGSAVALPMGGAALFASLLAVAMHVV